MYVIYHKETTIIPRTMRAWPFRKDFATERAAKSGLTRAVNDGRLENRDDYAIARKDVFVETIEKKVTKKNLMSGKPFEISVNAPASCDPSTETYWSM